ncbi:MAG: tRNA (adenosine(37)-N6)-dimethylallyltransferase MiaA [Anaerolineales bacterium]|nr:tRNA (adenosine(37)-N6)-dimethylallyltransferase MiaA [Anaerolineales bacterium]
MTAKKQLPPLIIILGASAVGKTELSLKLARQLRGEIVSGDSRLIYRGMDIGTAKPTPEEMAEIPHHLINVSDLDKPWSLAIFQRAVCEAILDIHARGKLPILVGGTGQYIRAITEGWEIPAVTPDPAMRGILHIWANEIGAEGLHARLKVLDSQAAMKIDHRNLRRTIRALEVILSSGKPFSAQRQRRLPRYHILKIGLYRPRPELYQRVDIRLDAMIQAGLIGEIRKLLAQGYSPDLPGFSAIGYRDMIAYIQGKISLEEAVTLIKRRTRVFVRHQANWFKMDDPTIHWFRAEQGIESEIEQFVTQWLLDDMV